MAFRFKLDWSELVRILNEQKVFNEEVLKRMERIEAGLATLEKARKKGEE